MEPEKNIEFDSPTESAIIEKIRNLIDYECFLSRESVSLLIDELKANSFAKALRQKTSISLKLLFTLSKLIEICLEACDDKGNTWTVNLLNPVDLNLLRVIYGDTRFITGEATPIAKEAAKDEREKLKKKLKDKLVKISKTTSHEYVLVTAERWNDMLLNQGVDPAPKRQPVQLKVLLNTFKDFGVKWRFECKIPQLDISRIPLVNYTLSADALTNLLESSEGLVAPIDTYMNLVLTVNHRYYHVPLQIKNYSNKTRKAQAEADAQRLRQSNPQWALLYFTKTLYERTINTDHCHAALLVKLDDHASSITSTSTFLRENFNYPARSIDYRLWHINAIVQVWIGEDAKPLVDEMERKHKPKLMSYAEVLPLLNLLHNNNIDFGETKMIADKKY